MTCDYSLWLLPPPRQSAAWRALIRRLAAAFDAPAFEPHVTLLGGIAGPPSQVLAAAREWAAAAPPPSAHPRTLACLDEYYRCVFVELDKTPALLAARRRAEDVFHHERGDYSPHLSLLYGRLDAAAKQRAVAAVAEPFDEPFPLPSAALVEMDAGDPPADWQVVEVFPLAARAEGGSRATL